MTSVRAFVLTRPRVLIPGAVGLLMLLKGWVVIGLLLVAVSVMKAARLLGDRDLERLLKLKRDKHAHGIDRVLSWSERQEIIAIERYQEALVRAGVEPTLAREPLERAWEIIARADGNDAASELRVFRQGLPPVPSRLDKAASEPLGQRLERELEMLEAARRELDATRVR